MSASQLCPECQSLLSSDDLQSPHEGLQIIIDQGGYQLFRCMDCNAFAALALDDREWSFNLLGIPVSKPPLI